MSTPTIDPAAFAAFMAAMEAAQQATTPEEPKTSPAAKTKTPAPKATKATTAKTKTPQPDAATRWSEETSSAGEKVRKDGSTYNGRARVTLRQHRPDGMEFLIQIYHPDMAEARRVAEVARAATTS